MEQQARDSEYRYWTALECEGGPGHRGRRKIVYPELPEHRRKQARPRPPQGLRLVTGGTARAVAPRPILRLVDAQPETVDMMSEIDSLLAKCRRLKELRNGQDLRAEASRVESVRRFMRMWNKQARPPHRDQLKLSQ